MDSTTYHFIPKDLELSLWIRLTNYFSARSQRTRIFKDFCLNNGVDYPPEAGKHYVLPGYYTISIDGIDRLAKIRDKILLKYHEIYITTQRQLVVEIKNADKNIAHEKDYLNNQKKRLTSYKNKLKSAKDPVVIISLQSKIAAQEAKIKNQQNDIDRLSQRLKSYKVSLKGNQKSWQQQVEIIDGVIDLHASRYTVNVTKKITNRLNYTDFRYNMPQYSDSVKSIVKGDDYERV